MLQAAEGRLEHDWDRAAWISYHASFDAKGKKPRDFNPYRLGKARESAEVVKVDMRTFARTFGVEVPENGSDSRSN